MPNEPNGGSSLRMVSLVAPAEFIAVAQGVSSLEHFLLHSGDTSLFRYYAEQAVGTASFSPATGFVPQGSEVCPGWGRDSAIAMPDGFMVSSFRPAAGDCDGKGAVEIDRYRFSAAGELVRSDGVRLSLGTDAQLVPRDGGAWVFGSELTDDPRFVGVALDDSGVQVGEPFAVFPAEELENRVAAAFGERAVASSQNGTEKGLRFQVVNSDASAGPTFELFPDGASGSDREPQLLSSPDGASLLVMRQVSIGDDQIEVTLHRIDCAP